jgi:hypothetical protein
MHIPTKRDTSTRGTITAMSKVCVLFLLLIEQYVSLMFEHRGLPSNLVTQLNNNHKRYQLLCEVMVTALLCFLT